MKRFPIPVRSVGPGSQPDDDAVLDMVDMPHDMAMFRPPCVDDALLSRPVDGARQLLGRLVTELGRALDAPDPLAGLPLHYSTDGLLEADRLLLAQVLGEGEVCISLADASGTIRMQESVFAGVWSIADPLHGHAIEVALIPGVAMRALAGPRVGDSWRERLRADRVWPEGAWTVPGLLPEIEEAVDARRDETTAYTINLSLLPMGPQDAAVLDECLGRGSLDMLSRGYGNCRIANTAVPDCWRVVYFNSQDKVILDTVEIARVPQVACAAREDFEDTHERLADLMHWIDGARATLVTQP